jgi:hypothetical protein
MERAGIDIISDREIRRESYSNRFATALGGMDLNPGIALIAQGIPILSHEWLVQSIVSTRLKYAT